MVVLATCEAKEIGYSLGMEKDFQIKKITDWEVLATSLIKSLIARPVNQAVVIALVGDLGAGKTTFTQILGRLLGVSEKINSPTFNIMKIHALPESVGNFTSLVHLDVYRFESETELTPLNFATYLKAPEHLVVIEWADKIAKALPLNTITLKFTHLDNEERQVTVSGDTQLVESI